MQSAGVAASSTRCPATRSQLATMRRWQFLIATTRWPILMAPPRPACAASSTSSAAGELGPEAAASRHPLVGWVEARGGKVQGAAPANLAGRDGGSGWGLKATADAPAGAKLIDLPTSCHLTYSTTSDDPRLLAVIDQVPAELWGAKLALQLLANRLQGPDSAFAEYISNLPRGVPGIPTFFRPQAVEALDYPPVVQQVKKRGRWLHEFSTTVLAKLPGTPADPFNGTRVDINALGWAMAAVSSRAFRTRGPSLPAAMLPLVDMCNHSFDPNAEVLPTPSGVGVFARRKVSAAEPILLSYGKLNNDFLLMDYGFIVPGNPHDSVQLRFDVGLLEAGSLVSNATDAMGAPLELGNITPWKQALLAELRLAGPGADLELHVRPGGEAGVDGRLLAAARVLASRDAAEVSGRGVERLCQLDKPLSKENEEAALRVVWGVCAVALSNFGTTRDQDRALLAGEALPPTPGATTTALPAVAPPAPLDDDTALAVRFRLEKKLILAEAVQALGLRLRAVRADKELRERAGAGQAPKGAKPQAATGKGFGKQQQQKR